MVEESTLRKLYLEKVVFIDTCACVQSETGFQNFILASIPVLKETKAKIHIAYKCIEELGKIYKDSSSYPKHTREAAYHALKVFEQLQKIDALDVRGTPKDSFADSVMLQNLLRYFVKYDILLITQDRGLASDAEMLNHLKSVKSKKTVTTRKLDTKGNLVEIELK